MPASAYLQLIRRWGIVLAIGVVLGALAAFLLTERMTPTYESTSTILVEQLPIEGQPVGRNEVETGAVLASVYTELVTTQPILERAITDGGLTITAAELRDRLSVEQAPQSPIIRITGAAATAADARAVSVATTDAFIATASEGLTTAPVRLSVVEPAGEPIAPVSPRRALNVAAGALAGLLACAGVIAAAVRVDNRVTRIEQVEAIAGVPALGEVHQLLHRVRGRGADEDIRTLRARLLPSLQPDDLGEFGRRIVVVTGPRSGEGTSVVAANLALAFGVAGFRTLIVDANLRDPALTAMFGAVDQPGLIDVLASDRAVLPADVIRETGRTAVSILPAGPVTPASADLVASAEVRALFRDLREAFDLVIVDAPPLLEVADASALAALTDLAVVVARPGKTRASDLRAAVQELTRSGRAVAGVVLDSGARGSRKLRAVPDVPEVEGAPELDVHESEMTDLASVRDRAPGLVHAGTSSPAEGPDGRHDIADRAPGRRAVEPYSDDAPARVARRRPRRAGS